MIVIDRIKTGLPELSQQSLVVKEKYGGKRLVWYLDMVWCLVRYGARPLDYVRFEFEKKSGAERNKYLTIYRYFNLNKQIKKEIRGGVSGCKHNEYTEFSDFIKREWILVNEATEDDTILSFIRQNHVVIAKPDYGEQGHGVIKIDENDNKTISEFLIERKTATYVLEECIMNIPELAQINPSSLNTIRCYTLLDKNGNPHIMEIMLRVGKSGSHVDNWGAGGVGYCFDVETGVCSQYGVDKLNRHYSFHPGSNYLMIGYRLPQFDELKEYIFKLVKAATNARYVGWDIAITPKGFDLVEMNCPGGHDFLQVFGRPWGKFIKDNW